jgi:hypothetical protein
MFFFVYDDHSWPSNMLSECIWEVKSDLRKIFEWSHANLLKLNPAKSMVLPICRRHLLSPLSALFLDDDFIPYVYKAKNLTVTFSYDHVSPICRKVYGALVVLWRLVVVPFVLPSEFYHLQ